MVGLALLIAATQAQVSLQYYQGSFFIRNGALILPVQAQTKPDRADFVRFRRGDTYTVWDKRGLAIRAGHWVYDTRLKEIAVSPKLFNKQEIVDTLARAKTGVRGLEADSLAGAMRLGKEVYLLPRWIDKRGYTWLEALVKVDLSLPKPKPQLVGRFPGVSLANGSIDTRLFPLGEQVAVIVRKGTQWGVSTYDPLTEDFLYTQLGERLRAYAHLENKTVAYVEAEDAGMSRVGVADLQSTNRNDMLEDRGGIRLLDDQRPLCAVVSTDNRVTLRNLQTSAAIDLPSDAMVRRTALGVLAWWPKEKPKHAVVLEPSRWEGLGNWEASPEAKLGVRP